MKKEVNKINLVHIPTEPGAGKLVKLVVISDTHNETEKLQHFVPDGIRGLSSVSAYS